IGTDASGTAFVRNTTAGITIQSGAKNNRIGTNSDGLGDAAERNIISGNNTSGVLITNIGSDQNVIAGNYIGTDITGTNELGNKSHGIQFTNSATNNTVGGTPAAARNVISGNTLDGVNITGPTYATGLVSWWKAETATA